MYSLLPDTGKESRLNCFLKFQGIAALSPHCISNLSAAERKARLGVAEGGSGL